jgi:hypothetical protein
LAFSIPHSRYSQFLLFAKSSLFKRLGGYLPFFQGYELAIKNCHTNLVCTKKYPFCQKSKTKINIFQARNNLFSDEIQNKNV